jgi:Uncharacterized membrane protein (homolog of Drosophila rhomboid)
MSSINMGGAFRTPPVVQNLIIINVLVFMAQTILPFGKEITHYGALYYWGSPNFHIWQYLTHMFLHGGMWHIFFNMFSLWMFGRTLEYDLGSKRFLIFYMVCGIGAGILYNCVNWIQYQFIDPQTAWMMMNIGTVGASGAIYGVLLGFGMMHPNAIIMPLFPPIPIKAKYLVIIFMVIELLDGIRGANDGVAHFAHVTGMISAFLLLRYWKAKGKIYY